MVTKRKSPHTKSLLVKRIWLLPFLVLLLSVSSYAQRRGEPYGSPQRFEATQETVPEELQVSIFLKILTYDRSLEARVKDTIRIGVLYLSENAQTKKNKDAFIENLKLNQDKTINGIPFNFTELAFTTEKRFEEATKERRINVLYVTSDGSDIVKRVSPITHAGKILTITGRVDYVNQGISVGLAVKEEKPQVVINLPAARAEGSDFSSNLLRLCKVIN